MKKLLFYAAIVLLSAALSAPAAVAQTYMTSCFVTVTGLREYNGKYAYVVGSAETTGTNITGMSPKGTPCLIEGGKVTVPLYYQSEDAEFSSFSGGENLAAGYYMFVTDDGNALISEFDEPETYRTLLFSSSCKFKGGKATVKAGEVIGGVADSKTAREKNGVLDKAGKEASSDVKEVGGEVRGAAKDVVKEEARENTKKWVKGLFN